tara:strand:- start:423 stop:650 length:228 start_codon:yes stop_codon:yes gene_type:complete
LNTPKFNLTTSGELIVETINTDNQNDYKNNNYNMESLVNFQQQRIEALQEHIKMLEDECKALYEQIDYVRVNYEY